MSPITQLQCRSQERAEGPAQIQGHPTQLQCKNRCRGSCQGATTKLASWHMHNEDLLRLDLVEGLALVF